MANEQKAEDGRLDGRLELVGRSERITDLKLEAVAPSGERADLPIGAAGEIRLDPRLVGQGYQLEMSGPGGKRRYSYDLMAERLRADTVYRLPEAVWQGLIFPLLTCVTGRVRVCWPVLRPPLFRAIPLREQVAAMELEIGRRVFPPYRCHPVCQGKVEVFVRTCCCPEFGPLDPPIVIKKLCEIIDCRHIWPIPRREPEPGPIGPRPGPGPDPGPLLERATSRALRRAEAGEAGAPSVEQALFAYEHLSVLTRATPSEQLAYIKSHPVLRWWCCSCTTKKVGEAVLQPDGHFDFCYKGGLVAKNCTRRVLYRVSQYQNDSWVVVYDGPARNESFDIGDDALLNASFNAHTCPDEPQWPSGLRPFVSLEQIGNTWADALIQTTQQNGETSFTGPLGAKDGLVNELPAGPVSITSGPYDQPWAATLNLRFQFHPGLANLPNPGGGAKYYRVRVVRVNANGQPLSSFTWRGPVSWRKYDYVGGKVVVKWVDLANPPINNVEGLYTIPYPDAMRPWLGGQWHAFINTKEATAGNSPMPNGRYLFVVDVFNAAGERLVPDTLAAAAGERTQPFDFLRLIGPLDQTGSTVAVPYKTLASLFWVDNLACYADIEQIVFKGVPSMADCQFLTGCDDSTVQLRYSARHLNGFQWYHQITYKRGLTGPTTVLSPDAANRSSYDSPALTVKDLLGTSTKCAFAASLYVWSRHTDGITRRLWGYDAWDSAAFALETTGPCP